MRLSVRRPSLLAALALSLLLPAAAHAAPPAAPHAAASASSPKPVTEEWVYRTRYGHRDEWWSLFRKYQIAILERQKQLGYVLSYTVWSPGLHTSEDARWDYRVIIVRASADAPPGKSEGEVARELFPDQATFQREENRRWELTENHWDLPIHEVKLDGKE